MHCVAHDIPQTQGMRNAATQRGPTPLPPPKIRLQVGLVRKGDPETHCPHSHLDADEQILKVYRLYSTAHQSDEGEEEDHHALRGTEDRWREEREGGTTCSHVQLPLHLPVCEHHNRFDDDEFGDRVEGLQQILACEVEEDETVHRHCVGGHVQEGDV